jgi:uncharacterized protein
MTSTVSFQLNRYEFTRESLNDIASQTSIVNNWPLVYILSDENSKIAYVGETLDTVNRMNTHLKNEYKKKLTTVHLIDSELFNKSVTLDIESSLIRYFSADQNFSLLNGNLGLVEHSYYQKKELYKDLFLKLWDKLRANGLAKNSIEHLNNSDLFKYSPYKSLSSDQRQSLLGILYALLDKDVKSLVVQGGAGTGKSILAIFLFKLLNSDNADVNFREFASEETEVLDILTQVRKTFPNPKMALVVPMSSFRETLKKTFRNISGLNPSMVIGPAELATQSYDIVLVDESHRLRKRVNLGAYFRNFDIACEVLGFDKNSCSELDWVTKQSNKAILFYDQNQTIKPSDANQSDFDKLMRQESCQVQQLVSQFRVGGGNAYSAFISDLLNKKLADNHIYKSKAYDFILFDSIEAFVDAIKNRDQEYGLSRMIAGYSWPWISKNDPSKFDIQINNMQLRWNRTNKDWINSETSPNEVGCIHTTQGYDLNYSGIIFGEEICFDEATNQIVINKDKYFDKNGKQSINDPQELKQYILNIYQTIMLRGIKGTYVYACDPGLRKYFSKHIPIADQPKGNVIPITRNSKIFENAVPLYDMHAAAGGFSDEQVVIDDYELIPVPSNIRLTEDYFAFRVEGESMNRIIPNGSICLFRKERGGSRNGKLVLVELREVYADTASRFTVKEYRSIKAQTEDSFEHIKIELLPKSYDDRFEVITLSGDGVQELKVVGEFVQVIDDVT